jgi:hypothetical protein
VKLPRLSVLRSASHHVGMTNDKFQIMCEQILVPLIGELLHVQLAEVDITLSLIQAELIRIGKQLEAIGPGHNN